MSLLVRPAEKWLAPAGLLASTAFLPFKAASALIPLFITILPHQMTDYREFGYQALSVHYAAFPTALVFFAACAGLGRAAAKLRNRLPAALAALFVILGAGLLIRSPYVEILPLRQKSLDAARQVMSLIPRDASVWAPGYFVAHLACRKRIKTLTDREYLHRDWFEPDYLLMDGRTAGSLPEETKKDILRVFAAARYKEVARNEGLSLFQRVNP